MVLYCMLDIFTISFDQTFDPYKSQTKVAGPTKVIVLFFLGGNGGAPMV